MVTSLEQSRARAAARVRAILAAARRIADGNDMLGQQARRLLPATTGLSPAGVELGLTKHLETHVSEQDLASFIAAAGAALRVHVLLSANVFVGAVRAVALAAAAAPWVRVRASRREAVMPELLRRALGGESVFELVDELAAAAGDEIHVYGRDETVTEVTKGAPRGVRVRGHGAGFGVALVDGPAAAPGVSWDVIAFDQRGCLSPRVVFVDGSRDAAGEFAAALAAELEKREREVPRGVLADDERHAAARYVQTLLAVGRVASGASFVVGLDPDPRALLLPPPGRHVHVVPVADGEGLGNLLGPLAQGITCIGQAQDRRAGSSLAETLRKIAPGARWSPLGEMQTPPLDGPVDRRGML